MNFYYHVNGHLFINHESGHQKVFLCLHFVVFPKNYLKTLSQNNFLFLMVGTSSTICLVRILDLDLSRVTGSLGSDSSPERYCTRVVGSILHCMNGFHWNNCFGGTAKSTVLTGSDNWISSLEKLGLFRFGGIAMLRKIM